MNFAKLCVAIAWAQDELHLFVGRYARLIGELQEYSVMDVTQARQTSPKITYHAPL